MLFFCPSPGSTANSHRNKHGLVIRLSYMQILLLSGLATIKFSELQFAHLYVNWS